VLGDSLVLRAPRRRLVRRFAYCLLFVAAAFLPGTPVGIRWIGLTVFGVGAATAVCAFIGITEIVTLDRTGISLGRGPWHQRFQWEEIAAFELASPYFPGQGQPVKVRGRIARAGGAVKMRTGIILPGLALEPRQLVDLLESWKAGQPISPDGIRQHGSAQPGT
jgi:hypothetical protein